MVFLAECAGGGHTVRDVLSRIPARSITRLAELLPHNLETGDFPHPGLSNPSIARIPGPSAAAVYQTLTFFGILRHVVLRPLPYADPSYNAAAVGTGLAKPLNARYRVRAILQRARHHREFLLFLK